MKWWGPNGFTNTVSKMDMVPGGEWNLVTHGRGGMNYTNNSIYREIIPQEKIVYEHVSAPKFIATIDFEKAGDRTLLSWHMLFETADEFDQVVKIFKADEGLKEIFAKLAAYLMILRC